MTSRLVGAAAAAAASAASALLVAGCGGSASTSASASSPPTTADQLTAYLSQVEAVRLPVNDLLEGADPILDGLHAHSITTDQASSRMDDLEQRFAAYTLQMAQIQPSDPRLRAINAPYAHTYLLEDSYLSTLASDLVDGHFDNLPDTQTAQRLAIIEWRTQLEVLAAQLHVALPDDIQEAGRGEIAPAPVGS